MARLKLEDFIFETLSSISNGVMRAKEQSRIDNSTPIALSAVGGQSTGLGEQLITFKVTLEVTDESSSGVDAEIKGGIISVLSGRVGAQSGNQSADKSAHTVEFSVPMNFNAKWRKDEDQI